MINLRKKPKILVIKFLKLWIKINFLATSLQFLRQNLRILQNQNYLRQQQYKAVNKNKIKTYLVTCHFLKLIMNNSSRCYF